MKKANNKTPAYSFEDNFGEVNLESISVPFKNPENSTQHREFAMVQKNTPCKFTPCVSGMKKSIKLLMD